MMDLHILKYFVAFLLALISCEAQAGWVQIAENDRAVAYGDTNPEFHGNSLITWILFSYKEIQVSPRSGRRYLSEKAQLEIDCTNKRSRTIFYTWHSKSMGFGTVVYTGRKAMPWEPTTAPNSYAKVFQEFYCKESMNKVIPSQSDVDKKLIEGFEKAAKEVNRTAPIMVDNSTRLDKATVGPGAKATYHYTFPGYSSKELDSKWLVGKLRPGVLKNVCSNEKMKPSLEYGGLYVFSYSGNDGIEIVSFQISSDDCGFARIVPRIK